VGETAGPDLSGPAEGAKLPRRYVAEKTSPIALELKKSPSSLRKYELCKALLVWASKQCDIFSFLLAKKDTENKKSCEKGFCKVTASNYSISLQEINYEGHMFVKIPEIKKRADNEE
jgi:hypothetical protein